MPPLRSLLFVPANRPSMLEKALTRGADGLLLDLEDAVPLAEKPTARASIRDWVARLSTTGKPVFVRINAAFTGETIADIEACLGQGLAGVVLPKAEPDTAAQTDQWLSQAEQQIGLAIGSTPVLPLIETARGVELAYQVASGSRRVSGLALGAGEYGDLAVSLGCGFSESEVEFLYSRCRIIVAARAAGLETVLDGVWTGVDDLDGLRRSAPMSRSLGFSGRLAIHPAQVSILNDAFSPTADEVERAKRVLEAFTAAQAEGKGTSRSEGLMVDYAMAARARQILAQAERIS